MANMLDRRQDPRYPCQVRVGIIYPDNRTKLLWAHDISERGLNLHIDEPIPLNTVLRVSVFVYNVLAKRQIAIQARTRVCSCVFDTVENDFRLGLLLEQFADGGHHLFQAAVETISAPLTARIDPALKPEATAKRTLFYPLRRRIQLSMQNGSALSGWTESVTTKIMRINLSRKLAENTTHHLALPIVLPQGGDVVTVHAKALVQDVAFRPMGSFAMQFQILNYAGEGEALLQEELRQRFPDTYRAIEEAAAPAVPTPTPVLETPEALQPLATRRQKKPV